MTLFLDGLSGALAVISALLLLRQEIKGEPIRDKALAAYAIAMVAYLIHSGAVGWLFTKG